MDYKRIFKTRGLRHKILSLLSFIPDKPMLMIQYKLKFGKWPDLKNPKRFSEKIQVYKLYYRNPVLPVCSDKYAVRQYLEEKGLAYLLPKLYGVYEQSKDIDVESLPDKFVIKTNDGGGGNNVFICRDKRAVDWDKLRKEIDSWLNVKNINPGREWAYTLIPKSLILIEEYLENEKDIEGGIEDYKFYCFNGKAKCIQYDEGRYTNHKRNFYDGDWNQLDVECFAPSTDHKVPKPENFIEMKSLAEELSRDFPSVRVDLYSVKGKIYFGELTFYTGSGYTLFEPDDFDLELGKHFDVSSFMPSKK